MAANDSNIVPRQDQGETTTMPLHNQIKVNGVTYQPGQQVKVPKAQADDLARIDFEATEQKNNLVRQPKEFTAPAGLNPMTNRPWNS